MTGSRSEYDILYAVMRAVDRHPDTAVRLVVTGAHLADLYGRTADQIALDEFPVIARIESLLNSDTAAGRAKSAGLQLLGLVDALAQHPPDVVVAMGDREEALTVAVSGAYLGIPIAHIGGGDHAEDANVDNSIRHAVTKLAHLHFVTTPRSAERVMRMGEESWRVHIVGAPGLDRLRSTESLSRESISRHLGFDAAARPLAVVIQHSISTEIAQAGAQMRATLEGLADLDVHAVVLYPNSDPGSHQIIAVVEEFVARYPHIRAYKHLPRPVFVNVLRHAAVLVGNSSCGIIEAPSFQLPAVNVGSRQVGREHAGNVLFVAPHPEQIQEAVRTALHDKEFLAQVRACQNPYGDGRAGERIAEILATVPLDDRLRCKRSTG